MSVDRITRNCFEHGSKRKISHLKMLHQEGNKRLGEMSHGGKEERGRKLRRRRRIGRTEMDGEAWLMDEAHTWKSLRKKKKKGGGEYGG
jgi:hypothetical protein